MPTRIPCWRSTVGEEALQWFLHAAEADVEGVTDAEDRVSELG